VAIIGAGFGGVAASVALRRAGIEHVLLERAGDLGGTWRDNSYPGCRCDVPSNLYSYSFALNPEWSHTYPAQAEIWEYLRSTASRLGVVERIRFDHEVTGACWDEAAGRWRIDTSHGPWTADVLVAAAGPLSEPSIAPLPGLDHFKGAVFHSAAWDHEHDFTGERVAVIGNGASAVQFVPRLREVAARLVLFQRTPAWVLPHSDRPVQAWERRLYRRLPALQRLVRWRDYWVRELVVFRLLRDARRVDPIRRLALQHLERQVADPELRRRLTPTYAPGCKRLLLSNDFYPSLAADNVELVTDAISEVRGRSIVTADGVERPVDTLVMATGFRITNHPVFERLRGRDGRSLTETWRETGAQAYLGTTVAGFPNLFLLGGPNTVIGHTSFLVILEAQVRYVLAAMKAMERRRLSSVDVRPEVQASYNAEVRRLLAPTVWNAGGCASWYLDAHGRNTTLLPEFTWRFVLRTRSFDPRDYELEPGPRRGELVS
jgi:cation diffusion facilitator CzcD-associated flavoprotein CzcO